MVFLTSHRFSGIMPRYYAKKVDKVSYAARSCNLPPASLARYVTKIKAADIDVSTSTDDVIIAFIKSITVPDPKTVSFHSIYAVSHNSPPFFKISKSYFFFRVMGIIRKKLFFESVKARKFVFIYS